MEGIGIITLLLCLLCILKEWCIEKEASDEKEPPS